MCGIAGVIGRDIPHQAVSTMLDAIGHRGPDGRGVHYGPHVALGAVRLSIVGGPGGNQPIYPAERDSCIVFNGEIYNYRELRESLTASGCDFLTDTDTEVILHLYRREGPNCVRRLHGMYAFAILDGTSVFLARDPVGMKPLYLYEQAHGNALWFASEIKALLRLRDLRPALNMTAVADSVVVGHPCGSETFVEGVRCLMPGETLTASYENGRVLVRTQVPRRVRHFDGSEIRDLAGERRVRTALASAVHTHLEADAGVAIALSGGVDSALLATMAGRPLRSFTVAEAAGDPDATAARSLAAQLGFRHHEIRIRPAEYAGHIADAVLIEEQPPALGALPLYFMFGSLAKWAKVALMGEGADEVFGGYADHVRPDLYAAKIAARLRQVTRAGLRPTSSALALAELRLGGPGDGAERGFRANLGDALVRQHLELVDKYSMARGVEVRLPYLDSAVLSSGLALPVGSRLGERGSAQKLVLREMLAERLPVEHAGILTSPKRGFPASGIGLLRGFAQYCEDRLPDRYARQHELGGLYDRKYQLVLFDLFRFLFLECRAQVPDGFRLADFLAVRAG